jgi:hypothetical protein
MLNVPCTEKVMTSEEGNRLEALIMQEIKERERLGNLVHSLREEVADLKKNGKTSGVDGSPRAETAQTNSPGASCALSGGLAAPERGLVGLVDSRDALLVSPERLDAGDAYQAEESIWDACLFAFDDSLGLGVSLVLSLLWLCNLVFQGYFCYLVEAGMTSPEILPDTLTELLHFRAGIAHDFRHADKVARQSMASQLCNSNSKLSLATSQYSLHNDIDSFFQVGPALMVLAQLLWICTSVKEMTAAWNFVCALLSSTSGSKTRVVVADSDGASPSPPEQIHPKRSVTGSIQPLHALMVVTRLTSVSHHRYYLCLFLIAFPRMVMAVLLCIIGIRYLGVTNVAADLILNAIALEFISGIDELLFAVFAPRRVRTLIANLEPMPMPNKHSSLSSGVFSLAKITTVGIVMVIVHTAVMQPFLNTMEQARDILCAGETDFVYAENAATGMVHVTKSSSDTSVWTSTEKAIIQVAKPHLNWTISDWSPDADILALSTSDFAIAVFETEQDADRMSDLEYDSSGTYFEVIHRVHEDGVAQAVHKLQCQDLTAGQSVTASTLYLQSILQNSSVDSCQTVPWQACSDLGNAALRAICPVRCGCDLPARYYQALAGFFQTPTGGCPQQCQVLSSSANELLSSTAVFEMVTSPGRYACEDLDETQFSFSESCVDTDGGIAVNKQNRDCSAATLDCSSADDDDDFTATSMCCKCGGGLPTTAKSLDCVETLSDSCVNMKNAAFSLVLYLRGLFEHLTSGIHFKRHVASVVENNPDLVGVSSEHSSALVDWVSSGNMRRSLANGTWELMPGVAHPRNLRGCEFLASFEVKALLGIDLCRSDEYTSMKFFCPVTCGCTFSVYEKSASSPGQAATWNREATDNVRRFSNDEAALSECPASCVLAHPQITGSTAYDGYSAPDLKPHPKS